MGLALTWPVGRGDDDEDGLAEMHPPAAPVMSYVLASIAGGALTALVIALLAAAARALLGGATEVLTIAMAALAVVAAFAQWRGTVRPLAERRKQVPRRWLLWRSRTATGAAFGFMIGSGALTYLEHATAYVLVALIALAPSVELGVVIGAVYGLSRGMTVVVTWIGDRWLGRRPDWNEIAVHRAAVNRALAAVGLGTVAAALALLG